MKRKNYQGILVACLGIFLLAGSSWAAADPVYLCLKTVDTQSRVYFKKVVSALRVCEDQVANSRLPANTDCQTETRAAAKISRAADKLTEKIGLKCTDGDVTALDFGADCSSSANVNDLTTCLQQTHLDAATSVIDTVYDVAEPLSHDARICKKKLAIGVTKVVFKKLTLLQKCNEKVFRGALPPATDCNADQKLVSTLAKLLPKTAASVAKKCPDDVVASTSFGASCAGSDTGTTITACAICRQTDAVNQMAAVFGAAGGASHAEEITDTADCVGGPLSRCTLNDFLLANDKIRVVVQKPERNLYGVGQFGGQIIDGDIVRESGDPDRDNFEEWSVSINIENTAHYTDVSVLNDGSDGTAAIVRATGVDDLLDFLNPSSVVAGFGFQFPASADDIDLPVTIVTDYILEPNTDYVRVETTVQNQGGSALQIFFGDFLNAAGEVDLFQPGYAFGEPLTVTSCNPGDHSNPCNFLAWPGRGAATGVSYGYVHEVPHTTTFSTSGVTVPQLGTNILSALIGLAMPNYTLEPMGQPGDSRTFTRYFVVGNGSVSSITDARNQIDCLPTGHVEGTVTAGGVPAGGAQVAVIGSNSVGPLSLSRNVVTIGTTDSSGHYSFTLRPDTYTLLANLDGYPYQGGGTSPAPVAIKVPNYGTVDQDFDLPATGALQVYVLDENGSPIAAKVSVVGFDPSPLPLTSQSIAVVSNVTGVFADPSKDGLPFGIAKSIFVDPSGDSGVVPIEPASYRVVVSHGPEYSISTSDVTVTAGNTTVVNATVEHVIDSSGFISGDFHVHSIQSPDSTVAERDRVVSMLAEGVDFFASTDHDHRVDFQPVIDALGASSLISTTVGEEITSFDYGHFNAWPMDIDPNQVNGGAVDFGGAAPAGEDFPSYGNYNLSPAQIIAAAHADPGQDTVQINHIHSHFGLDAGSGLAIDTGVVPPQSAVPASSRRLDPSVTNFFSDTFDALEIWIGDDRPQVLTNFLGQNAGVWFNLMNQGIVRSGIADSDTHKQTISPSGFPRNMVASPTDDPGAIGAIAETISANVNAGRSFGTDGPMVRVTAYAASTGETAGLELGLPTQISTTDGAVTINVSIQSPTWAQFDKVEYYINTTTTRSTLMDQETGAGPIDVNFYSITPDYVQTAPTDFTISTVPAPGTSSSRLEATTSLTLSGLTEDIYVVVMVKGTDGVSQPLFPVIPNSLQKSGNTTLANLTDGNLGQQGILALAFTNPLFVDVDGGGWDPPGLQINP